MQAKWTKPSRINKIDAPSKPGIYIIMSLKRVRRNGNTKKLPPEIVLEIHTMCGHALIGPSLIEAMVEENKKSKKTAQAAADDLGRHCTCGIFNPYRAPQRC